MTERSSTIRAAAERLRTLRDAATPGKWATEISPGSDGDPTVYVGGPDAETFENQNSLIVVCFAVTDGELDPAQDLATGNLIATLSHCVDTLLNALETGDTSGIADRIADDILSVELGTTGNGFRWASSTN